MQRVARRAVLELDQQRPDVSLDQLPDRGAAGERRVESRGGNAGGLAELERVALHQRKV